MKIIFTVIISIFLIVNFCYAKTLITYHKNTGTIIQTNMVDEMPTDEIINDRFKTETTDIILVDESVNIATQRVDLGKKTIKNISQLELDNKKQQEETKKQKKEQDRTSAKEKLKSILTDEEIKALFE